MFARDKRKNLVFLVFMDGFHTEEEMEKVISAYFICMEEDHEGSDEEMMRELYHKVKEKIPELDKVINAHSDAWRTDRMDQIVLAILRVAAYEMMYDPQVPPSVSINEAVEFGKDYAGSGAYALINGILSKLWVQLKKEAGEEE